MVSVNVPGHAIGLRRIPTNEIEIFEPNIGILVFSDAMKCQQWLCPLLRNIYNMDSKQFAFEIIAKPPKNAVASVPPVHPEEFNSSEQYKAAKNVGRAPVHVLKTLVYQFVTRINQSPKNEYIYILICSLFSY